MSLVPKPRAQGASGRPFLQGCPGLIRIGADVEGCLHEDR